MLVSKDARILNILSKAYGRNFVDLGCGSGDTLDAISGNFSHSIGVDFSTIRRKRLHPESSQNWEFRESNLNRDLPIDNEWADAILVNQVIEHILDPVSFVKNLYRICSSQGLCIVTTPNIRYIRHIIQLILSGYGPRTGGKNTLDGSWDNGHIHYFTNKDLNELFLNAGFSHVESKALIDLEQRTQFRLLLDRFSSFFPVREFLSGNILLVAYK